VGAQVERSSVAVGTPLRVRGPAVIRRYFEDFELVEPGLVHLPLWRPAPRWLVDNYLVAETISVLFGPSGGGKTFVALDLALAIATGHPWLGEPVDGGYVVYP